MHGYKGFKDWGCWPLVADYFSEGGAAFIRFNFSHNGTTLEEPEAFADLDRYRQNTYSKELTDALSVLNYAEGWLKEMDCASVPIYFIGHSRGGGIALLAASTTQRVKAVITWAAVSDFFDRFPTGEALQNWRNEGVMFVQNARTRQDLPHDFSWYTDFLENEQKLNVKNAMRELQRPVLVVHAADDAQVHPTCAFRLARWNPLTDLFLVPEGGHTFGSSHPWKANEMPPSLQKVCEKTSRFISGEP
jgi:pimeloyl-ACP methyl ester carboxylesterase